MIKIRKGQSSIKLKVPASHLVRVLVMDSNSTVGQCIQIVSETKFVEMAYRYQKSISPPSFAALSKSGKQMNFFPKANAACKVEVTYYPHAVTI